MSWIKRHHHTLTLALILFCALAIRIGYVLSLENKVFWVDEVEYLQLSEKITSGAGYVDEAGNPTAFRPVGYPMFLAALRLVGIQSLGALRIVQCLIGAATVYLIYLLAMLIYNKRTALVAGAIYAVYPYFVFLPGTILASTWFGFLLVAATLIFVKGLMLENKWLILSGGLVMGYATLVRPSALLLILPVILWLIVNIIDRKKALSYSAAVLILFTAVVVPWMARNYQQLGTFGLSTNGGRNLWLGNNERTTPHTGSNLPPSKEIEMKLKTAKTEREKDEIYSQAAIAYIKNHPLRTAELFLKKAFYFWRWDPSPTTEGYVHQNRLHWWVSVLSFGPIFVMALIGFFYSPKNTKKILLLFVFYAAAFTLLHAVYFPKVRFRLPIDQFLIVMAGYGVTLVYGWLLNCRSALFSFKLKNRPV